MREGQSKSNSYYNLKLIVLNAIFDSPALCDVIIQDDSMISFPPSPSQRCKFKLSHSRGGTAADLYTPRYFIKKLHK